ncbi:MAG: pentapeptide repeat-containing protein [Prochlorotrichaceae cyanobacterium]
MLKAIATPIFLWMVWLWLLPHPPLQANDPPLASSAGEPLTPSDQDLLLQRRGTIAVVAAGLWLACQFRSTHKKKERANFSGAELIRVNLGGADLHGANFSGANLCGANLHGTNLSGADLCGANLNGANLSGADLSRANFSGANLNGANLNGADLSRANFRYANLSRAEIKSVNLLGADLRQANLSGANLNCTLINGANFSDANLRGALLFFINLRGVLNLEPLQLKAKPSPLLCNVALPSYSQQPGVSPNRGCDRIPQLLSDRYHISLEEAQEIVNEARQHRWN